MSNPKLFPPSEPSPATQTQFAIESVNVERELVLVGIRGTSIVHRDVIAMCRIFRAHIVSRLFDAMVVEMTGDPGKIERFLEQLPEGCVTHVSRSGTMSVPRLSAAPRRSACIPSLPGRFIGDT